MRELILLMVLAAGLALPACAAAKGPGPGDPAPPFTLPGSDGESHSLADHLGQRVVVVAWFPKANTPG